MADLTALKDSGIPCRYIVNASNPTFHGKGSGTNAAIHRACKFASGTRLDKLTQRLYQPPAKVGKAYPVDLLPAGPNSLTYNQHVHTVIHVVGPNMNPKRKNCLNGNYELGKELLKKSYEEILQCFYERCGFVGSQNLPLPRWCFKNQCWQPFDQALSEFFEHVYAAAIRNPNTSAENGHNLVTIGQSTIDFTNMLETIGQKTRKIRRGTWFWQDDDGSWAPYALDIANQLERAFQTGKLERVDVSHDPPRFVVEHPDKRFIQYRQTKGGNPLGRPVSRGFNHCTLQNN